MCCPYSVTTTANCKLHLLACWIPEPFVQEANWVGAACRHKEKPLHCQPEQLWSCVVKIYKNDWWSRRFLECSVLQLIESFVCLALCRKPPSGYRANILQAVAGGKVTRFFCLIIYWLLLRLQIWLDLLLFWQKWASTNSCSNRDTEKAWFKGKMSFWEGVVADYWWWPCEQKHSGARGLSNRKLILASCSSGTAIPVFGWVRVERLFLFELGF